MSHDFLPDLAAVSFEEVLQPPPAGLEETISTKLTRLSLDFCLPDNSALFGAIDPGNQIALHLRVRDPAVGVHCVEALLAPPHHVLLRDFKVFADGGERHAFLVELHHVVFLLNRVRPVGSSHLLPRSVAAAASRLSLHERQHLWRQLHDAAQGTDQHCRRLALRVEELDLI